ncbi:MAG: DUF3791 domain-containing protein [Proteobacteria bacterium]|nr:DUF3791 domain-containing protein [Pseudomonadota bacterium]
MDEQSQILFMQIRMMRITAKRLKRSLKDTAMLFRQYDVLPYIREGYGIFHVEGDDAVYEDVKKYLISKGAEI